MQRLRTAYVAHFIARFGKILFLFFLLFSFVFSSSFFKENDHLCAPNSVHLCAAYIMHLCALSLTHTIVYTFVRHTSCIIRVCCHAPARTTTGTHSTGQRNSTAHGSGTGHFNRCHSTALLIATAQRECDAGHASALLVSTAASQQSSILLNNKKKRGGHDWRSAQIRAIAQNKKQCANR